MMRRSLSLSRRAPLPSGGRCFSGRPLGTVTRVQWIHSSSSCGVYSSSRLGPLSARFPDTPLDAKFFGGSLSTRSYSSYPDHEVVGLPALSPTMEKGNLVKWIKSEGEMIGAGDVIAEVETDKSVIPWEAQDEAYLAKILVQEGTNDVACGAPIAIFVDDEDDIAAFADYSASDAEGGEAAPPAAEQSEPSAPPAAPSAAPSAPAAAVTTPAPSPSNAATIPPATPGNGRVFASPFARKVAGDHGLDVSAISGTGPGGRVIAADVSAFASQAPSQAATGSSAVPAAAYTDIPASNIRKVTAARLLESKQTIPHYYLTVECNIDKLMALRSELNAKGEGEGFKLSVNDFIVKASALALKKVPECNSSWHGDFIRQYSSVDINVAVNTDQGLFTPIVFNADHKGLASINGDVKQLAEKAKSGQLSPEEFMGGTFTISNLGMFGIKQFCAVINPPQSCILAVGGTEERVVKVGEEKFDTSKFMNVTLSCDHRVVDGAVGAQWLKAFRGYVEEPLSMLL